MNLKYVGQADIRMIRKSEWPEGVDHGAVEWNPDNGHVAEVEGAAGQWLLDNEKGDWKQVDASEAEQAAAEGEAAAAEPSPTEGAGASKSATGRGLTKPTNAPPGGDTGSTGASAPSGSTSG
jgi:hypothetical protein